MQKDLFQREQFKKQQKQQHKIFWKLMRNENEIENDDRRGTYDKKNLKFGTTMLNASLCDYSDAYILFDERITVGTVGTINWNKYQSEPSKQAQNR